ncbi:MAG: NAD(P)-dependent alcohol dehydrogenase [Gammaproteobacteria bacterium HGW-Gammaproteobacteria-14]|nr:MAG: NAD(P)-dependent alcohol dehydrogenase [Gammaproteobacteria bacterium HGW-Gammaproteobacteria-14]
MKAIVTTGWGFSPRLTVHNVPELGNPGPNDVLVKVHAASVNPKDWKLNYHIAMLASPVLVKKLPPLFGDDLAGTVLAVGSQVTDFSVGDAVYGMDMRLRTASLAEQTLISQKRIAKKPASLTFEEAASMPLAAQTALQGLRKGKVQAGSRVLIIGASGGVGTFAVQIAKVLGAHVTGVCSGKNADFVLGLGADEVIDYTQGEYRKTAGLFDLVFDVTSYESPRSCAALLAENGWFVSTGGDARSMLGTPLYQLIGKNATTVVVESWRKDLDALTVMVDGGKLKPIIDSEFDLLDSEAAYQRNRSGRCRGKVVIRVSE